MVKKVAVFGGTGMTGQCVVEYALSKGKRNTVACLFWQLSTKLFRWCVLGLVVRLLYRNEETLPESFKDKVELVKGDVLNTQDVNKTLEGENCVW